VFVTHVEASACIILPDVYIKEVAAAVHEHGGMFVLDCIASGAIWVDMKVIGEDILISAPQKGWSASPCGGLVMLSKDARNAIDKTKSTSFAIDLKNGWRLWKHMKKEAMHIILLYQPTQLLVSILQ
jgi:aspartate aminotransferase-like enzyme